MDKSVEQAYQEQIDRGIRCRDWLHLETTAEFLEPLRKKVAELKDISIEKIQAYDDKTFRSKIEAAFLAAREIEDYLSLLEGFVGGVQQAQEALEGKDVETY